MHNVDRGRIKKGLSGRLFDEHVRVRIASRQRSMIGKNKGRISRGRNFTSLKIIKNATNSFGPPYESNVDEKRAAVTTTAAVAAADVPTPWVVMADSDDAKRAHTRAHAKRTGGGWRCRRTVIMKTHGTRALQHHEYTCVRK